jgi:hypothetical protein
MLLRFKHTVSTFSAVASVAVVVPFATAIPEASPAIDDYSPVVQGARVGALAGAATLVSPVRADPVTPRVREVAVPEVDRSGSPHLAAVSTPQPVRGFGVVGATWLGAEPGDLDLEVRTKEEGSWSAWEAVPFDAEHGPDPGSAEARAAVRTGSDPVVVGDVGRVQLRASSASGEAPADLELSVVNPGSARTDAAGAAMTASPLGAAAGTSGGSGAIAAEPALFGGGTTSVTVRAAAGTANPPGVRAPRPRIRTRAAWGANERLRSGRPSYGRVRAGFVHHTVNANGYRRAQVPAIIRGIYAFHTQSNGWSDIGYNFLVDRFGRIWQGRFGDLRRNVIGAHTFGYNHVSFAMSAIGNFETARPSARMLRAYGRLMGWRLGKYGINAGAMRRRLEGRTFRAISGHRDAGSTACPGIRLYRKIGTIRRLAVNWQQNGTTTAPAPTEPPPAEPPPSEPPPTEPPLAEPPLT